MDTEEAHKALLRLTEQVLAWNQRLNLVSRKDCTAAVVYHRHVLPSVALLPLILENASGTSEQQQQQSTDMKIVDVGTGGGFPGLPLALLLPSLQFTLVDSIQKKLVAVSEMAQELDMTNVRIHCGRVEEMEPREHKGRYRVVLGRSVTALPRFCAWVSDLLQKGDAGEGRLIYIIGGELEEVVESRIQTDISLDVLLQRGEGTTDKRALVFRARDVREIARESGEGKKVVKNSGGSVGYSGRGGNGGGGGGGGGRRKSNEGNSGKQGGKKLAKGAWSTKRNDVKKERGYDDFKRYESR